MGLLPPAAPFEEGVPLPSDQEGGKGPRLSSLLDRRGAGDSKEKPLVVAGEGNRCRLMDENPTGSLLKELLQGKTKGSVSLQLSGSGKGGKEEALPPSVSRDTLGSLGGETGVEKGDEPALFQKLFGGRFNPLVVLTARLLEAQGGGEDGTPLPRQPGGVSIPFQEGE